MLKVQCPNCRKVCHRVNDTFDPDVRPHGGMVDLLEPWLSYGWGKFGEDSYGGSAVMAADMLCPLCQASLAPSGRLTLVSADDHQEIPKPKTLAELNQELINAEFVEDEIDEKPYMCHICEWQGKTMAALKAHITRKHNA